MASLAQLLQTNRQAEEYVQTRFNRLGNDDLRGHRNVRALAARNRQQLPGYQAALREAAEFFADVCDGRYDMRLFRAALSTDDFPYLFGDTIDRMMVAQYQSITPAWRDYLAVKKVRDFRDVKRFHCTRGSGRLDKVDPGTGYKIDAPTESYYSYAVTKYGRRRDILWEALVNDDLDALHQAPNDLAWQAANTEAYLATSLFCANATLYATSGGGRPTNGNLFTTTLTPANLQAALVQISKFTSPESEPMLNSPKYLVVPPALELEALKILNSATLAFTGDTDANFPILNILQGRLEVRVNDWLPIVDTTNGHTSWYLFSDPAMGWPVEVGFLQGHETPELFMKASNQTLLGGGQTNPMDGDFDTDSVAYKVRHVVGGSQTNAVGGWRFTFRSTGAGS